MRRAGAAVTLENVEARAPDKAALKAARAMSQSWVELRHDPELGVIWGYYGIVGLAPYYTIADLDDLACKCNCASRKSPCRHGLGLLLTFVEAPERFVVGPAEPERAKAMSAWRSRRDPNAAPPEPDAESKAAASTRAAKQRARTRARRHEAVLGGLNDLDAWIADQLDRGLARFGASDTSKTLIRRLVDAKAPGLADMVAELPGAFYRTPEPRRVDWLAERLGGLHLLAEAYRRAEHAPPALSADIRALVGWQVKKEEALADPLAEPRAGRWLALARLVEAHSEKQRRIETWFLEIGCVGDAPGAAPRFALLSELAPVSGVGAEGEAGFRPGHLYEGVMHFAPSAAPLLAWSGALQRVERAAAPWPAPSAAAAGLAAAFDQRRAALARQPWLERWPSLAQGVAVVEVEAQSEAASGLWLVDASALDAADENQTDETPIGAPLAYGEREHALPLVGVRPIDAAFLWDGRYARLLAAETPIGAWLRP